ncbi:MAG: prolipoprotein diacylglyceryl transferase [Anaerolineales bacterium]|nr:prolipoprotein diacylglyceryl transferase [Anaerolineales bacterium]
MNFTPYGIELGPLTFRYYGLIIMTGAMLAALLVRWLYAQMTGGDAKEWIWDALLWAMVPGVIGARLYHVLTPPKSSLAVGVDTAYYFSHPLEMLSIWQGGLGMPGALIGGMIGLYLYARKSKRPFLRLLDAAAPGAALAQAIGRWGNFINQELYGPPTTLPWKIYIRPENRMAGFEQYEYFHPLFLYECIWNLLNTAFLLLVWKRWRSDLNQGDLALIYMVNYGAGRFLLEFLRLDFVPLMGINFNQMLMLGLIIISGVLLFTRHKRNRLEVEMDTV